MVLPTAPTLLSLLVVNGTLDGFNLARESCLAGRYHGTYGGESVFMLDSESHCDISEFNLGLGWESSLIPIYPHHELLFIKRMEIEDGATANEGTLHSGLKHLVSSHTLSDTQRPLTNTSTYSVPYYTESSAILSISPHFLPHVDKALPPSYKAYALPKIPLPVRRVPDEAKERIRHWTDLVEYDDDISWIVEGLSIAELREDIRYLTGEDPSSPILSRSSFSEGGLLAAEWILEQIEETGAECELKRFLVGFAPNVIW